MYQKKSFEKIIIITAIFFTMVFFMQYATAQTINVDLDMQDPQETIIGQEDRINITSDGEEFSISINKINEEAITLVIEKTNDYITPSLEKTSTINLDTNKTNDVAITLIETIKSNDNESEVLAKIVFQKLTSSPKSDKISTNKISVGIFAGVIIIFSIFLITILIRKGRKKEEEITKKKKK